MIITALKRLKPHKLLIGGGMLMVALVLVFPPDGYVFKVLSKFVVYIMFGYLALGMFFLSLRDYYTMHVALGCCVMLCLNLRTRPPFYSSQNYTGAFSVATFNVSLSDDDYEETAEAILVADADIVAIQELTPDWYAALETYLSPVYPFDTAFVRIDFFGAAIYSKYPIINLDTFHYKNIPNFVAYIKPDSIYKTIRIISSHTVPPVNIKAFKELNEHLVLVAKKVNELNTAVITMGDYNVVPWSSEVLEFREFAELFDSRREMTPMSYLPVDHIFYSDHLQCVAFENIIGRYSKRIGIKGVFQINQKYVKKRNQ